MTGEKWDVKMRKKKKTYFKTLPVPWREDKGYTGDTGITSMVKKIKIKI